MFQEQRNSQQGRVMTESNEMKTERQPVRLVTKRVLTLMRGVSVVRHVSVTHG